MLQVLSYLRKYVVFSTAEGFLLNQINQAINTCFPILIQEVPDFSSVGAPKSSAQVVFAGSHVY